MALLKMLATINLTLKCKFLLLLAWKTEKSTWMWLTTKITNQIIGSNFFKMALKLISNFLYLRYKKVIFSCQTDIETNCVFSFSSLSSLKIWFQDLNEGKYAWLFYKCVFLGHGPGLVWIDPLVDYKFTLQNAIGNCAKTLGNDYTADKDASLYKSCFCCGDFYNPASSLGCPVSPWS